MDAYTDQYFGFIRPEFVSILIDSNDDVVGFGISLPNLTRALQKCNGRLFPFGFLHLLKAIRRNDVVDMYLIGVRPDYHGKGVTALIFYELHKAYIQHGIRLTISSNQLEENAKALTIWKNFENRQHIRRRCWVRHFS
jgi:GNAT superfamily N-acetyltransferase